MNLAPSCSGVSAVIVAHNSEAFLGYSIASLARAMENFAGEIIVVDNASRVNPQEIFAEQFPQVRWILSSENLGFGKACNWGAREAQYSHLLFVNPDTLVPESTIPQLIEFMEQKSDAGLCGCKILNTDGSLQRAGRRSFPTPITALARLMGLDNLLPHSKVLGRYNMTYLEDERESIVDAISGSFFCVHRSVFESVKGFDEDFFLYGEDLDLSFRVQESGWNNYYFPQVHVIHSKGHSSKNKPWFSYKHFYLAMLVFVSKHQKRIGLPLHLLQLGVLSIGLGGALFKLLPNKGTLLGLCLGGGAALFAQQALELAWTQSVLFTLLWILYFLLRSEKLAFNVYMLLLALSLLVFVTPWVPAVFLLMGIGEGVLASLSKLLIRPKKVAWFLAGNSQKMVHIPKGVDVNLVLRGIADLQSWKKSKIAQILQADEIWITGPEYFSLKNVKIAQELGLNQKEFIVISEADGMQSKLELNLLGTSLKLSKAL